MTPTRTATQSVTGTATSTPTTTPTITATPTQTVTPVPTSGTLENTPTPTPAGVAGDVDGDLIPDAAFVAAGGRAEVVLDLANAPRKVAIDSGVVAAGVGQIDGRWSVITVKKAASDYIWSAMNVVGATAVRVFSDVVSIGQPVMGCYINDLYAAAGYKKGKAAVVFTEYTSPTPITVPLPLTTLSVRCGAPEQGTSSVFYVNENTKKRTVNVVGVKNGKNFLSSQRLDPKFKGIALAVVPRNASDSPTVAILARLGAKPVLQVLDRSNKWRSVTLPRVASGSSVTGVVGVRFGGQSYLVIQITSKGKVTSYIRLLVPGKYL